MLYVVPTPIGNLEDITLRALRILKEVDLILAEDTRHTKRLLRHFEISTPTKSYHAHNEHHEVDELVVELNSGKTMALVSDAGTPGISDPGFLIVRACAANQIRVECLPGPTALIPALVASGLPSDKFHFEGFLPPKKGRQTRMIYLASLPHTFILYESPHRIKRTLKQLIEHCGPERQAFIAREITKKFETHYRDSLENLANHFESEEKAKGEFVLVIAKNDHTS